MEKSFSRSSRIAQELQKKLAYIIQYSLDDPRIHGLITVSEVRLSRDLSYSQIFISILQSDNPDHVKKILIILNKASGYIRKLLCKKMRLRIVPYIIFYHDDSFLKGNKISIMLSKIIKNNSFCL